MEDRTRDNKNLQMKVQSSVPESRECKDDKPERLSEAEKHRSSVWSLAASLLNLSFPHWECSALLMAQQPSGLGRGTQHHFQLFSIRGSMGLCSSHFLQSVVPCHASAPHSGGDHERSPLEGLLQLLSPPPRSTHVIFCRK